MSKKMDTISSIVSTGYMIESSGESEYFLEFDSGLMVPMYWNETHKDYVALPYATVYTVQEMDEMEDNQDLPEDGSFVEIRVNETHTFLDDVVITTTIHTVNRNFLRGDLITDIPEEEVPNKTHLRII